MMNSIIWIVLLILPLSFTSATNVPTAQTLNGTYSGLYSQTFNQDFFLGIPYATPPLSSLRFLPPESLNSTFNGTRTATSYSPQCVGYGNSTYPSSEDCLYLNVVRPAESLNKTLPVAVWIHGGGFFEGGSSDARYNLSYIVEQSIKIGEPLLTVSLNYRMSAWGFLYGNSVAGSGNTNVGLRDQRLALYWIQENIAGFGGDPTKVTIWGQGAGAVSVGLHATAYGGRNDDLFRAVIMQSGSPMPYQSLKGTQFFQPLYDEIMKSVKPSSTYAAANSIGANASCITAADALSCLRSASFDDINAAVNATSPRSWFPVIDGDFISKAPSQLMQEFNFVQVPMLNGANTDEGTFFTPSSISTDADFVEIVEHSQNYHTSPGITLPESVVNQLEVAYPSGTCVSDSTNVTCCGVSLDTAWHRACTYLGDAAIIAPRRATTRAFSHQNPAYAYRFNAVPNGKLSASHSDEIAFVFYNIEGHGYETNPFASKPQSYLDLADFMSKSWISFVVNSNPNTWRNNTSSNNTQLSWPSIVFQGNEDLYVFEGNGTYSLELDTFRAAGTRIINGGSEEIALAFQR